MDRNLSLVAVKFCVMVWVLVLRKRVTIHQLLTPLLQVQPSLTIQVLLRADIGIRDGKIVAISRGGNADTIGQCGLWLLGA